MSRRHDDDAAEARTQRVVGDLFGFGEDTVAFLPPSVQIGWYEPRQLAGGLVHCLTCCATRPTPGHAPVYREQLYATACCTLCKRPLDHGIV